MCFSLQIKEMTTLKQKWFPQISNWSVQRTNPTHYGDLLECAMNSLCIDCLWFCDMCYLFFKAWVMSLIPDNKLGKLNHRFLKQSLLFIQTVPQTEQSHPNYTVSLKDGSEHETDPSVRSLWGRFHTTIREVMNMFCVWNIICLCSIFCYSDIKVLCVCKKTLNQKIIWRFSVLVSVVVMNLQLIFYPTGHSVTILVRPLRSHSMTIWEKLWNAVNLLSSKHFIYREIHSCEQTTHEVNLTDATEKICSFTGFPSLWVNEQPLQTWLWDPVNHLLCRHGNGSSAPPQKLFQPPASSALLERRRAQELLWLLSQPSPLPEMRASASVQRHVQVSVSSRGTQTCTGVG